MASKKRTTAMEQAWIKAQKEKQRKAEVRDKAKIEKMELLLEVNIKIKNQNRI